MRIIFRTNYKHNVMSHLSHTIVRTPAYRLIPLKYDYFFTAILHIKVKNIM